MRSPLRSYVLWSSLAVLMAGSSAVRADYITGELINAPAYGGILNPGADVKINSGDGTWKNSTNYYPGVVNWTVAKAPAGEPNASWVGSVGSAFQTFCIELTQDISPGNSYTYNLVDLASAPKPGSGATGGSNGMGAVKATAIADLWTLDYNSNWVTDSTKTKADNIDAAAFQLAIWKIEYDWGDKNYDSFSAGNFLASGASSNGSSAVALAETWLKTLYNTNPNSVTATNLIALSNPGIQDQVMALPTPVPPTLYLAAISGVALILHSCRRRWGMATLQQ